jgi:hypothetical protein
MTFYIDYTKLDRAFVAWVNKKDKAHIRVGAHALLWEIWNNRNDHIRNKLDASSFLHVISVAAHWIRMWYCL